MYEFEKNILRYPRLDTVIMVEKAIKKYDGEFKKKQLWQKLPKKTMYQTYCTIIDYLLHSHRIFVDKEGKIGWMQESDLALHYYGRKDLWWRNSEAQQKSSGKSVRTVKKTLKNSLT